MSLEPEVCSLGADPVPLWNSVPPSRVAPPCNERQCNQRTTTGLRGERGEYSQEKFERTALRVRGEEQLFIGSQRRNIQGQALLGESRSRVRNELNLTTH